MANFKYTDEATFISGYAQGLEAPYAQEMYKTVELMEEQGGSFVVALANAWRHADPWNKVKLVRAFKRYFIEYFIRTQK